MRIVYDHAQQVGQAAATLLAAQLISAQLRAGAGHRLHPHPPIGPSSACKGAGVVDFSSASSFVSGQYVGLPGRASLQLPPSAGQLFDHVNMPADHIHIPDGNAADPQTECARYDQAITAAGGIDMQVLGIGRNGHIGFNEPDDHFTCGCHVVNLTESTIQANRRFFDSEASVPRQAVSLGVGSILASRCILLLATGEDKAQAIHDTVCGDITSRTPASILKTHPNVILLLDRAAAGML